MFSGSSGKDLLKKPTLGTPLACPPFLLPIACTYVTAGTPEAFLEQKRTWQTEATCLMAEWKDRRKPSLESHAPVIPALAAYLWISLKCERSTLLFSLLHCYFVLQLYAAELNVNWYIWLIRPRVMIWPQRSSLTLSCAPVPTPDHCLFPALVSCQFLEPLPTSGPSLLSSSAWNSLLLLCLANSCHFSDPSLKCHLLAENFSDSLI